MTVGIKLAVFGVVLVAAFGSAAALGAAVGPIDVIPTHDSSHNGHHVHPTSTAPTSVDLTGG